MTKRVLVTCSRSWTDWETARRILRRVHDLAPDAILVSGHARVGDQDLERIWQGLGGEVELHPVLSWYKGKRFNSQAGFERSEKMADLGATVCLAFIGPCEKDDCIMRGLHGSHGAEHCADYAEKRCRIPVQRFLDPILRACPPSLT